ncbi:MAG: cache domain-containing protein, partial [Anaerolineales bacterium]
MIFLPTLISETTYLQWPGSPVGWLGWFLFLMLLILLGWFWRGYQKGWNARGWGIAAGLFVFELAATLFIGIRIPPGQALPAPGLLTSPVRPALMVFAALPWVLAAGLLGPFASMGLAGLSGLLLALFDTHKPFLFLEYAGMGLIMGVAVNQRYRTLFFRAVRHPVVVSLAIVIMYPAVFVLGVVLGLEGDLPIVFDFGLTRVESATVVVAGSLLLAGVVGEVFVFGMPNVWGNQTALLPSPAEKSLETLSFYFLGPVVALVVVVVTLLGWSLSANLAQDLVEERMEGAGKMAAESIPYVLEVGQNLILQLASDSRLARLEASPLSDLLSQQMRLSPYFQELLVVNAEGKVVGAVPAKEQTGVMFPQEQAAIDLALQGVPIQYYTLHPALGGESARLSFIALVSGNDDRVERVLVGRSEFTSNPFASSIVSNLGSISEIGGEGILVDENGAILFHPNPNLIMT